MTAAEPTYEEELRAARHGTAKINGTFDRMFKAHRPKILEGLGKAPSLNNYVTIPMQDSMIGRKITIILPTINRSAFLSRLLTYYSESGFQGYIGIADSSNFEHLEKNKRLIDSLQGKLNIIHKECPELDYVQSTMQILNSVDTPYAAYLCDDDFLTVPALEMSAYFLENHPEYNAAWGKAIKIRLDAEGACGQVSFCTEKRQPVVEESSGSQRYLNYMKDPNDVVFAVHRVLPFRRILDNWQLVVDKYQKIQFFDAFVHNMNSAICGKIKQLDCLYLVRQDHRQRYFGELRRDFFPIIFSPTFLASYHLFSDLLASELVQQDAITLEAAREVIKQGFWLYLARMLVKSYPEHYAQGPRIFDNGVLAPFYATESRNEPLWRNQARRIPGARRAWHGIRSLISSESRWRDEMSLAALLHPSSPYHTDFMPIYRAVTTSPSPLDSR